MSDYRASTGKRNRHTPESTPHWVLWVWAAVGLYVATSFIAYAFRHPDMTFMNAMDAMLWR